MDIDLNALKSDVAIDCHPFLTFFLTIRHIDCTVFPVKNRRSVRLPTTRVSPARMAATASFAFAASISVALGPMGPQNVSRTQHRHHGESLVQAQAGLRARGWANMHEHRRGRQKRRKMPKKARLLLNIALSVFID